MDRPQTENRARRQQSAAVRLWQSLNRLRWLWRCPLKLGVFALVTAIVLYPKIWLLPTAIERYRDMNSVLDPDHPELAELEQRVRDRLGAAVGPRGALQVVQRVVCERVPYAWDWQVWGVCEYLPTVDEVFEQGREDCDGRAVVAASLLRRMGYEAELVSDLLHVWVATPQGETMSPTGHEKTFVGTKAGTRAVITRRLMKNLARGVSYGVAVFPLVRELLILATLCVLTMQPWSSRWRRVAGCVVLLIGLELLRSAGREAAMEGRTYDLICVWAGVALTLSGALILAIRVGGPPWRSATTRPE